MPEQTLETNNALDLSQTDLDILQEAEEAYKLEKYFEWIQEEEERKRLYFEWLDTIRREEAERKQRAEEAAERRRKFPATFSPSLITLRKPWDATDITDEERKEFAEILDDGLDNSRFASIAEGAVFGGVDTAKFLDDFLWNYVGDPYRIGQNMPKNPEVNDEFAPYKHDYNHTLVNGYTDQSQHLIHIRETYEQGVDPKERYLVIIGNVATRQVVRFRINDVEVNPYISTRLILTTERFDVLGGGGSHLQDPNTAESKLRRAKDARDRKAAHERQTAVQLSNQSVTFKAFDGKEEGISPIVNVVQDRRLLTRLAVAAGVTDHQGQPIWLPEHLKEAA